MISFETFGTGPIKIIGVHGWFGDASSFKSLEQSLDPARVECAWLNIRGYGKSADLSGEYTMEEVADDIVAVADSFKWDKFSLIGHSMGGKAAQICAAKNWRRVAKLVAVASVPPSAVPFDVATRNLFENVATDQGARCGVIGHSVAERTTATWVRNLAMSSIARTSETVASRYLKSWADDDLSGTVMDCPVETLICYGEFDPVITQEVCEHGILPSFPNGRLNLVHNSGHYPFDEAPLEIAATIEKFLDRD